MISSSKAVPFAPSACCSSCNAKCSDISSTLGECSIREFGIAGLSWVEKVCVGYGGYKDRGTTSSGFYCGYNTPLRTSIRDTTRTSSCAPIRPVASTGPRGRGGVGTRNKGDNGGNILVTLITIVTILLVNNLAIFTTLPRVRHSSVNRTRCCLCGRCGGIGGVFSISFLSSLHRPRDCSTGSRVGLAKSYNSCRRCDDFLRRVVSSIGTGTGISCSGSGGAISMGSGIGGGRSGVFAVGTNCSSRHIIINSSLRSGDAILSFEPFCNRSANTRGRATRGTSRAGGARGSNSGDSNTSLMASLGAIYSRRVGSRYVGSGNGRGRGKGSYDCIRFRFASGRVSGVTIRLLGTITTGRNS